MSRVTVVLDATELRRDWMLVGFRMQLLASRAAQGSIGVSVPASVLEELVAHHERESATAAQDYAKVVQTTSRLGLHVPTSEFAPIDYRANLLERFDEVLNFTVLDWPGVSHAHLVSRAVGRIPPFDAKGGGYRDSLVWASVLELVVAEHDVVLVSADRAFAGQQGELHPSLQAEVEPLSGSVSLVQDLSVWLLSTLPTGSTIVEAVQESRDEDFSNYYFQSDIQSDLFPSAGDIGFTHRPIKFEAEESEWGGDVRRVSAVSAGAGSIVAEYDINQVVSFRAILPNNAAIEAGWEVESSIRDEVTVVGQVDMLVRMGVLFDADMSFVIDDLSWRRADGSAPGPDVAPEDPTVVSLF